jgi:hypothetical protein
MNKIKAKLNIHCLLPALALLLLLMPIANVQAESQPPSPTPSKAIESHNSYSEKSQNYTAKPQQRGTEAVPSVVKVIQSSASEPKANKNAKSTNDKSLPEWWLVYVTAILVLVTFGLAIYTAKLWQTTRQSLDITKESVDLARKEFVSAYRPKLIIRSVTIKPQTYPAVPIEEGKPVVVEGVVVNVGNTPTEIVESNVTVLVGGPMFHARTPFGPSNNNINGVKLVPGGAYTFWLSSEQIDFKNASDLYSLAKGEKVIYFFGFIMYRDDIGNTRRTAYCRRYDPIAERFTIVNDPDYEYTD